MCLRACICFQPLRCQVPRGTLSKRFRLERYGRSGTLALQGKSLTNRFNLQISYRHAWCKGHHVGRGNRYTRHDLRAEGIGGGTFSEIYLLPAR